MANFEAVARLSSACKSFGVPFYHIGTDYVFDGGAKAPIPEDAVPNPINEYGKSKLAGEEAALKDGGWCFGSSGCTAMENPAFVDRILNSAADSPIKVRGRLLRNTDFAEDVAGMLVHLIGSKERGFSTGPAKARPAGWILQRKSSPKRGSGGRFAPFFRIPGPGGKRPKYTVLNTKAGKTAALRPWQQALGEFQSRPPDPPLKGRPGRAPLSAEKEEPARGISFGRVREMPKL